MIGQMLMSVAFAAVTYATIAIGNVAAASSGTGAVTPALPTGIASGDLLILLCETANEAVTTPTGWTIAPSSPQSTGTAAATTATRLSIFYRIATGSDSAPVIADPGDHLIAQIMAFTGVDQTTPFNASAGDVNASASTAVTVPAVTTTCDNAWILACCSWVTDTATAQASGQTNANLSGGAERMDASTTSGNGGGFSVVTGLLALAGNSGTTAVTLATSSQSAKIALALQPAIVAPNNGVRSSLLHFNGTAGSTTIVNSDGVLTFTAYGAAALTTTTKKFGTAAMDLSGSSYYRSAESVDWSGQFSLAIQGYRTGYTGTLLSVGEDGVAGGFRIYQYVNQFEMAVFTGTTGGGTPIIQLTNTPMGEPSSGFRHLEITRDGAGMVRIFVNGAVVASVTDTTAFSGRLTVGEMFQAGAPVAGSPNYIYDEQQTIGGDANHTSAFTAPSAEYS
jgi:hypothetical protein